MDNLMLEILETLKNGGKSTNEIATMLGLPSRKISQTLIKLKNKRIIYTTNVPHRSHLWHLEINLTNTLRYKVLTRRWDKNFFTGEQYDNRG